MHRCPLLVVAICNAVAEGLMQPWLPATASSAHKIQSATTAELAPSPVQDRAVKRVAGKPSNTSVKQKTVKPTAFSFSADALPHLKAAADVRRCSFCLYYLQFG